ncbi:MAG: WYL domain-containing protein [Clostridia bacterium]
MTNPKLRIFLLLEYFFKNTDESHTVTIPGLIEYLDSEGIVADRRTLYADLALLKESGMEIIKRRTRTHDYYLGTRDFELAELKLLVDAVQSCRFLSTKKSAALIKKLEGLTSRYQAAQLSRQVFVQNRIKTDNERIYYNVDSIHDAIHFAKKISFQYCQYTMEKTLKPRRDGILYIVSPYLLTWAEDNYYLIADHPKYEGLVHFRVDKMIQVSVLQECRRQLSPLFDPVAYAKSMFSMYAGDREWVELTFDQSLIGVAIDRFGTDVAITPLDDSHFAVHALVSVSPAFFGWLLQFGDKARIIAPDDARERMIALLTQAQRNYET